MKAKLGPDHPDTLIAMHTLALTYRELDRLDEAIPLFEEVVRLKKAKLGPDHPDTLVSINDLVDAYLQASAGPRPRPRANASRPAPASSPTTGCDSTP